MKAPLLQPLFGFLCGDGPVIGTVQPLGKVPHALPVLTSNHGHLADDRQQFEHPWHLVRSVPAALVAALHHARVRDLGCQQRPLRAEPSEHVLAKGGVRLEVFARRGTQLPGAHQRDHVGHQAGREEPTIELEQQAIVFDGLLELPGLVPPSDPTPERGLLRGRDRHCRIDLDAAELLGDLDDIAGTIGIQ